MLCVARVKGQQMKFGDSLAILLASLGHDKASRRVSCTEIDSVPDMKRRTLSTAVVNLLRQTRRVRLNLTHGLPNAQHEVRMQEIPKKRNYRQYSRLFIQLL